MTKTQNKEKQNMNKEQFRNHQILTGHSYEKDHVDCKECNKRFMTVKQNKSQKEKRQVLESLGLHIVRGVPGVQWE